MVMPMSKTGNRAPSSISRLYPIIHDLQPLLEYEDFTLRETPLGGEGAAAQVHDTKGTLQKAIQAGALEKIDRERSHGKLVWRYAWTEGSRERLLGYLDELETLPKCGHRVHVPDTRDDPDGVISCKHCGEEYVEAFFKEMVRGSL
jgi:hypothetical protein